MALRIYETNSSRRIDSKGGANLAMLHSKIKFMKGFFLDVETKAAAMRGKTKTMKTAHLAAIQEHEMVVRELGEEGGRLEEMRHRVNEMSGVRRD